MLIWGIFCCFLLQSTSPAKARTNELSSEEHKRWKVSLNWITHGVCFHPHTQKAMRLKAINNDHHLQCSRFRSLQRRQKLKTPEKVIKSSLVLEHWQVATRIDRTVALDNLLSLFIVQRKCVRLQLPARCVRKVLKWPATRTMRLAGLTVGNLTDRLLTVVTGVGEQDYH